jgi:ubiquinol-cytochrome c reductase cytochrome b subunit
VQGRAGNAAHRAFTALDQRLPAAQGGTLLRKVFPDHWSFLLGEIALYSFVVLLLTGVYLTFFFDPSMSETVYHGSYAPLRGLLTTQAYSSALRISFDVRGGLLIRQTHHWAALVFVAAVGAHMLRIFFTGAFRTPREGNWLIGVTLFQLAMLEGFCGYSLPDDLLSGTGLRTAATIIGSIPVAGTYLEFFAFGGVYPGHSFIPRLYVVHILLVPGALVGLITAHLILVVYLKHTHWGGPGRSNRNVVGVPMVPQFTAKTTGFFFMVFGLLTVLGGLAQVNPIWRYGPYRADQVTTDAQPDWYVGFLEGALRLMPAWETGLWGHTFMFNVLLPAVVLPAALFVVLYLYPFFEQWVTGDRSEHHLCDRPRNRPTRTAFGVAALSCYAVLLLAGGNDVIAYSLRVSVNSLTWLLRGAVIVVPLLAFAITKRICLALQARDRDLLGEGQETGRVSQDVDGRIDESVRPLPEPHRYTLLLRDVPVPLRPPGDQSAPVPRRLRLRLALSAWYYCDRVELPAAPAAPPGVAARAGEPLAGRGREGGGPGGEQDEAP